MLISKAIESGVMQNFCDNFNISPSLIVLNVGTHLRNEKISLCCIGVAMLKKCCLVGLRE
jgi:hypothetical protein